MNSPQHPSQEILLTTVLSSTQPFIQQIFFENLDTEIIITSKKQTTISLHIHVNFCGEKEIII